MHWVKLACIGGGRHPNQAGLLPVVHRWCLSSHLCQESAFRVDCRVPQLGKLSLLAGRHLTGAVLYGLAVHWRVFPVLYSLPIWICLGHSRTALKQQSTSQTPTSALEAGAQLHCMPPENHANM